MTKPWGLRVEYEYKPYATGETFHKYRLVVSTAPRKPSGIGFITSPELDAALRRHFSKGQVVSDASIRFFTSGNLHFGPFGFNSVEFERKLGGKGVHTDFHYLILQHLQERHPGAMVDHFNAYGGRLDHLRALGLPETYRIEEGIRIIAQYRQRKGLSSL